MIKIQQPGQERRKHKRVGGGTGFEGHFWNEKRT
jgi:hypothetical protein